MNNNNLKLGVEVIGAHNLLPKDGQGSSNAFAELSFDGQRHRTTVKDKDLNPIWNETFFFHISDSTTLNNQTLELSLFNHHNNNARNSFLGKLTLAGTSFVPLSDAVVFHYPLEKRGVFSSRVRGEIGLKVFITDQANITNININKDDDINYNTVKSHKPAEKKRHTFHHLPKNTEPPQPNPKQEAINDNNSNSNKYVGVLDQVKPVPPTPTPARVYSATSAQAAEFSLKETSPFLGGGRVVGGRVVGPGMWARVGGGESGVSATTTYDLVEKMYFLYVRVVKARELEVVGPGSVDPFVEVRVGNYKGVTKHFESRHDPEWGQVFAFSKDRIQSSILEVVVKDKNLVLKDDFVGIVPFDVNEVPLRVPPDSPLAPEWYRLEDKKGEKVRKGEVMVAVWIGTQGDEAFSDAWHSDAVVPVDCGPAGSATIRSKVYQSPRLWYVRVNVIEAQDLIPTEETRFPDVYVKVQLGHQVMKTKIVQARTLNALWNEDLVFVAAEPFEDNIVLTVEDRVGPGKDETIGRSYIPLNSIDRRADDRTIPSRWFNLEKPALVDIDQLKKDKFSSRVHLRICLDGGYHVLDESTHYSSDLRPTAKQLWKPPVGVLELGILNASGLHPMKTRDGRGTSDTYCVAKYGQKWVRTRTLIDDLSPRYNEQYTWEVFDPATVLTVGVFDNSQVNNNLEKIDPGNKDLKIGKIRIRISTLEAGRIYTHSYPLLVLNPSGVKKMGELHLAVRFTCRSLTDMLYIYTKPLLPKMHYVRPFHVMQLDILRHHAVNVVAARLGRSEPPLRKEVVEYMSDVDSHMWSMRRSKANFFRLMTVFSGAFAAGRWLSDVCGWRNPVTTVLVHVLFLMLVSFPELILPTAFLYMFLIGVWNYRYRAKYPPHMNIRVSQADGGVHPDEMDEEFDTFPTTRAGPDVVRLRYDRLRSLAGRIQTAVGDVATQGERFQALLSWRDPRATAVFIGFCLVAAVATYVTPFQVVAAAVGLFSMRHPRFRRRIPAVPVNFFRRLPARTDCML